MYVDQVLLEQRFVYPTIAMALRYNSVYLLGKEYFVQLEFMSPPTYDFSFV